MFPALERALDVNNAGPLILLTGYQTPPAIRRAGTNRLTTWLRNRKVRGAQALATAAVGGSLDAFPTADRLAAFGGVAPAPHDSGKSSGNLHRPQRYHRRLQRVFYTSALISIQRDPNSRRFYDRKRAEGKRHTQAVLALARRRVDVIWALVRDGRCYEVAPPVILAA